MRAWVRQQRAAGARVAFVPTMGALHEGHLRLIDRARALADRVVASVFVNPLQFAPGEDFARYPRDAARDQALLEGRGTDALFLPGTDVMYPVAPAITLDAPSLTRTLCAPHRPGHFAGVLTVVVKLFHIVEPDVAVFGRKDVQQAVLVRRLAGDLDFALAIEVAPTVREADGVALSSRNAYLSPGERQAARALSAGLDAGHRAYAAGAREPAVVIAAARELLVAEPGLRLQYCELVDPATLAPSATAAAEAVLAVAAFAGATRLIDNVVLGRGCAGDDRLP